MRIKSIFIPKPIYELFPLLYLSLGASCIAINQSIVLDILGTYLIIQALFKLILRLNYRSPLQALTQSPLHRSEQ